MVSPSVSTTHNRRNNNNQANNVTSADTSNVPLINSKSKKKLPVVRKKQQQRGIPMSRLRSPLYYGKYRPGGGEEEPFHVTFIKVGVTILLLAAVTFVVFMIQSAMFRGSINKTSFKHLKDDITPRGDNALSSSSVKVGPPPSKIFPPVKLPPKSKYDAFGISSQLLPSMTSSALSPFLKEADSIRTEFASMYGGENTARDILAKSLANFGSSSSKDFEITSSLRSLANRIHQSKVNNNGGVFRLSFGGDSATTGRGNSHSQSYPFTVQNTLRKAFQTLGITLQVNNVAMADTSSLPHGFCLDNNMNLNEQADVISWDFQKEHDALSLEAYLRQSLRLEKKPMIIIRNNPKPIEKTQNVMKDYSWLTSYVRQGFFKDILFVNSRLSQPYYGPIMSKETDFILPQGFTDYNLFGSPPNAPERSKYHLTVKQHQFIGWTISMHFLAALEIVAADLLHPDKSINSLINDGTTQRTTSIPPPVLLGKNDISNSILFGQEIKKQETTDNSWTMNPTHCQTTFQPTIQSVKSAKQAQKLLVLSGTVGEDIDLMLPKGSMLYSSGWVYDMPELSKLHKTNLDRFGDFGFVDLKIGYFGIPSSGILKLFVPFLGNGDDDGSISITKSIPQQGANTSEPVLANTLFRSIMVCGINEPKGSQMCDMEKDMTFVIGGANATNVKFVDIKGASYLKQKLCVTMDIPNDSEITAPSDIVVEEESSGLPNDNHSNGRERRNNSKLLSDGTVDDTAYGVILDISVTGAVTLKNGACSVSHLIWEEVGMD